MDGVGTPIIGRPRPLSGQRRAPNVYTVSCEEPDIWSLDEATAAHLARATLRLSAALRDAVKPEGLNVIQSNGVAATQTVFHLHVHLVPRWEGDAMGAIWPEETNYSEASKDEMRERIRQACSPLGDR